MTRFEPRLSPVHYFALALISVLVFVADLRTPLGVAVWVVYLIPIVLSLFTWRPGVPIALAVLTTGLMALGFFTSPAGITEEIARINRGIGMVTVWGMATVAQVFIRNKIAVKKQEWLQNAETGLSECLVGEQSLDQLGENALRFLCEYLDAHAGALFAADDDGFRRIALYAGAADGSPERFLPGEGLPGQAARDRRAFIVRDVPDGYLPVASGLGRAAPRTLLIAPATHDGSVQAVVELGFIHPVYESDPELMERISGSLAVAVRSAQYRARLQALLEETQCQAEELQAQSEELRVNNEELEEQSRALKDSQSRLEIQQAELEQTNAHLEQQADVLESQRDELRRAGEAMKRQARDLEQASRYKSEFLSNMSHELRTPLNSSLILAKLLADNPDANLTEEQVRYAQTIQAAGADLLSLINDILDLSKIEAGRIDIQVEPLRLPRVIENLERIFKPIAADKGLAFRSEVTPGTPEELETDPKRLEQILKNLLANAIKFTEKGEVALVVSSGGGNQFEFTVQDTGIGIPADRQAIIFDAFRQADGATSRKYGGTGLGLSISRELARLLGGDIRLQSELDRGSAFTLSVPQAYDPERIAPPESPPAAEAPESGAIWIPDGSGLGDGSAAAAPAKVTRTRRIKDDRERLTGTGRFVLVVEDDERFARILYDLARELNFQCLLASSAEEAVALAAQFLPSAVLLDVGLPDHSGLTVLDRLKNDSRTRHIPVHVISGTDHSQTALALGAVGYMLKPVRREELVDAFEGLETRMTRKMRRVLVVEDDPAQADAVRRLLSAQGVDTVEAHTAQECLDRLRNETFDCMVLDLSLPDKSGLSLLETLSREDRYSFPPVIVYTGRDLSSDEEQQLRKYAKSIIIKGAKSPERLLDEVTLFLHQVVSEMPAEHQRMLEKARSRDEALEGRRILVVEDDVRNIFALSSILEPRGAAIEIARNGREALDVLEKAGKGSTPAIDLVLMDIMMPEMDGLTAMREIRKRPEWKKLPIIALTAKAMKSDQEECLAAGASDYVAKPLDVDKLLSLVRVWMPR